MPKLRVRHAFVAVMLLMAMLVQGTWALAGTTGNISGTLTDSTTGKAVANAKIAATSPTESASTTTDASGHFTFLSLAPDTYTIAADKEGFDPVSLAGVTVFADQIQTVSLTTQPVLRTIARVTSRAAGALVKPGTTSDVYSVNASTAAKVTGLGGGGSLDQAYSAIATMPGAYVPVGQAGWYQTVYIRGGDYDQVGYEVDGVPVNRAFDNYPSSTASALGQQEVQVYTGASPANAEGQGLAGYINQVIKTGTYPGFGNADLGIGSPIFYHKGSVEAGGAAPSRNFSYYAGFAGYNQDFRTADQSEGAQYQNLWGTPFTNCPTTAPAGFTLPGCYDRSGNYMGTALVPWYVLGPFNYNGTSMITDRENVVNFHFGIPHKNGGRDDLQLLWQSSDLKTFPHLAPSDWGSQAFYTAAGMTLPTYASSLVYTGPVGVLATPGSSATALSPVIKYGFPSVSGGLGYGGVIPFNTSDSVDNAIGMVKVQYQKNFGSDAYLRLYGYTTYSDWFNWGPNSAWDNFSGSIPTDYELSTHTRGVSGTFAKQLTSNNLLLVQGSYTAASSLRMNNTTMFNGAGTRMGVLVDSTNPLSGICYNPTTGAPANCDSKSASFSVKTLYNAQNAPGGTLPAVGAGITCNGHPCAWYIADTGYAGRYNTVQPKFTSGSITDDWNPTDRLHLNLGLRYDRYEYDPSKSDIGTRSFWYSSWNTSWCISPTAGLQEKANPTVACPAGYVPATQSPVSYSEAYTVTQPRIGMTYTLNQLNVLRLNYGEYDQAPNAAFEQYDALNQNLAKTNRNFLTLGFTSPSHPIVPSISYNTDFSWEHQLKGTDMSFKVTPFYRTTKDQIQQFYLDIKTNFVSGLNVGQQTSSGVEFQFQKGDFNRNGLAGLLSYTYTHAMTKYKAAPNGKTPITDIDNAISNYNAFTSACATGGSAASQSQYGLPVCGSSGVTAAPCYTTTGTPIGSAAACTAGTVANPYWNAKPQGFYDPFGSYAPYDLFPAASPGAGNYGSFVTPHVATLVLNYKHDKWAITPALQFSAGNTWGYPISTLGVDPTSCTAVLAGSASSDPRYPYGGNGSPYDASACGGTYSVPIPNPATGKFDAVGGFKAPSRLTISTQLTYDVSPKVSAVLTLANVVDRCFGGTSGAWSNVPGVSANNICGYGGGYAGVGILPVGNNYNPPFSTVQPFQQQSYYPAIGTLPFNAYLDFKIKL